MGNDLGFMRSHLSRGLRLQVGRPERAIWCGVCAALVAAGALLGTSPWTPMTWDEGDAIRRAESIRDWFSHAFRMEASGPPALSREGITRGWAIYRPSGGPSRLVCGNHRPGKKLIARVSRSPHQVSVWPHSPIRRGHGSRNVSRRPYSWDKRCCGGISVHPSSTEALCSRPFCLV